jgi:hypothetical protein
VRVFERLFLAIYIPVGIWACLHAGISWDEQVEYETLITNINAVKGLFSGNLTDYQSLLQYRDRYYGIGFHLVSHSVAQIALWINAHIISFSDISSEILFTHLSTFALFFLSGLLVKSILEKLINDLEMARFGMVVYLLWPYLLGHSFVNVKDVPFLFAWLLCTNIYLKILQLWHEEFSCSKKQVLLQFFLLGLATAWLLSIRISGLIIFIEYAACFLVYLLLGKCRFKQLISIGRVVAFGLPFAIGVFVLYPVFWHNPLEAVNAIQYMSQHPWDGNTLTAGKFLAPRQATYFYIPAWLLVKLPLVIMLGLIMIPFVFYREIKNIKYSAFNLPFINLIALFISVALILLTLVIIKAGLYNELRQILFIFPLIYILGFVGFYLISKKFLTFLLAATAIFFVADNFALYPYSYVYMNEVARQTNISSKFEKDYLGLSIDRTTSWLNQQDQSNVVDACAVVTPAHLWKGLDQSKYPCVQGYENFTSLQKPFFFSWLIRDHIDLLPLSSCKLIHEERVSLPLSPMRLVMSQLFFCDPNTSEK